MHNNIFISYSSFDRDRATVLADQIHSKGFSVWMDSEGIDGAMNWSSQIVTALNNCDTLLFLISKQSASSHNCAKEIQLASEKRKNILPIILEDVYLPVIFEYPLAGLQRLKIADIDNIMKALTNLRDGQSAHDAMMSMTTKGYHGFLRLAVLPFEDLSPTHDNEWFAHGMMDELIGTLGSLSKLIVPGRSSVMVYKKDRPKASVIGEELEVRYIVEGTVRKAGDKIRISASLTDTKTNTQLWHNKFDGTFDDIFDFQERVAREITDGLKLKLTPQDEKKIEEKITENPESYELYQKANTYFNRYTKQDFLYALDCLNEAVKIEVSFATAYALISRAHTGLYRGYDQSKFHLSRAKEAVEKAQRLNPDLSIVYYALSDLYFQSGEKEKAIEAAKKVIELDPKSFGGHFQLAFIYSELWEHEDAAKHFEEAIRLNSTNLGAHTNLCIQYDRSKDIARRNQSAERALPYFEWHLKKNPDDQNEKMNYAILLEFLGRMEESLRIIDELISAPNCDGNTFYNCACMIVRQEEYSKAIEVLVKAVGKGYANLNALRSDPDLNALRGMAEYKELLRKLEVVN